MLVTGMMMMVVTAMAMGYRVRLLHVYPEMDSRNPLCDAALRGDRVPVQMHPAELPFQRPFGHAEIKQRPEKHIAADAGKDVEVEDFHWQLYCSRLFPKAALQAAPKIKNRQPIGKTHLPGGRILILPPNPSRPNRQARRWVCV